MKLFEIIDGNKNKQIGIGSLMSINKRIVHFSAGLPLNFLYG